MSSASNTIGKYWVSELQLMIIPIVWAVVKSNIIEISLGVSQIQNALFKLVNSPPKTLEEPGNRAAANNQSS
jgi:hypothetical protein